MFFFGSTIYAPPIVPTLSVVLGNGNQGSGIQVKNIGDPTLPQDAVTLSYLQSSLPPTQTLSVVLNNGNNGGAKQIKNIADPTHPQDAVTLSYLQSSLANSVGFEQNFLLMGG